MRFEPGSSRFQEQNTATEPRRLLTYITLKNLRNLYAYDSVLANFSQVPPLWATQDLFRTNLDLLLQLLCVYHLGGGGWSLFKNQPFGLYLGDHLKILKILVCEWYILCHISTINTYFTVLLANLLEIFTHGQNLFFFCKNPAWIFNFAYKYI